MQGRVEEQEEDVGERGQSYAPADPAYAYVRKGVLEMEGLRHSLRDGTPDAEVVVVGPDYLISPPPPVMVDVSPRRFISTPRPPHDLAQDAEQHIAEAALSGPVWDTTRGSPPAAAAADDADWISYVPASTQLSLGTRTLSAHRRSSKGPPSHGPSRRSGSANARMQGKEVGRQPGTSASPTVASGRRARPLARSPVPVAPLRSVSRTHSHIHADADGSPTLFSPVEGSVSPVAPRGRMQQQARTSVASPTHATVRPRGAAAAIAAAGGGTAGDGREYSPASAVGSAGRVHAHATPPSTVPSPKHVPPRPHGGRARSRSASASRVRPSPVASPGVLLSQYQYSPAAEDGRVPAEGEVGVGGSVTPVDVGGHPGTLNKVSYPLTRTGQVSYYPTPLQSVEVLDANQSLTRGHASARPSLQRRHTAPAGGFASAKSQVSAARGFAAAAGGRGPATDSASPTHEDARRGGSPLGPRGPTLVDAGADVATPVRGAAGGSAGNDHDHEHDHAREPGRSTTVHTTPLKVTAPRGRPAPAAAQKARAGRGGEPRPRSGSGSVKMLGSRDATRGGKQPTAVSTAATDQADADGPRAPPAQPGVQYSTDAAIPQGVRDLPRPQGAGRGRGRGAAGVGVAVNTVAHEPAAGADADGAAAAAAGPLSPRMVIKSALRRSQSAPRDVRGGRGVGAEYLHPHLGGGGGDGAPLATRRVSIDPEARWHPSPRRTFGGDGVVADVDVLPAAPTGEPSDFSKRLIRSVIHRARRHTEEAIAASRSASRSTSAPTAQASAPAGTAPLAYHRSTSPAEPRDLIPHPTRTSAADARSHARTPLAAAHPATSASPQHRYYHHNGGGGGDDDVTMPVGGAGLVSGGRPTSTSRTPPSTDRRSVPVSQRPGAAVYRQAYEREMDAAGARPVGSSRRSRSHPQHRGVVSSSRREEGSPPLRGCSPFDGMPPPEVRWGGRFSAAASFSIQRQRGERSGSGSDGGGGIAPVGVPDLTADGPAAAAGGSSGHGHEQHPATDEAAGAAGVPTRRGRGVVADGGGPTRRARSGPPGRVGVGRVAWQQPHAASGARTRARHARSLSAGAGGRGRTGGGVRPSLAGGALRHALDAKLSESARRRRAPGGAHNGARTSPMGGPENWLVARNDHRGGEAGQVVDLLSVDPVRRRREHAAPRPTPGAGATIAGVAYRFPTAFPVGAPPMTTAPQRPEAPRENAATGGNNGTSDHQPPSKIKRGKSPTVSASLASARSKIPAAATSANWLVSRNDPTAPAPTTADAHETVPMGGPGSHHHSHDPLNDSYTDAAAPMVEPRSPALKADTIVEDAWRAARARAAQKERAGQPPLDYRGDNAGYMQVASEADGATTQGNAASLSPRPSPRGAAREVEGGGAIDAVYERQHVRHAVVDLSPAVDLPPPMGGGDRAGGGNNAYHHQHPMPIGTSPGASPHAYPNPLIDLAMNCPPPPSRSLSHHHAKPHAHVVDKLEREIRSDDARRSHRLTIACLCGTLALATVLALVLFLTGYLH